MLRAALEPAEGVGRSLCELTEFSAKTRDARGIRNEHDSAKFQARPSPPTYKKIGGTTMPTDNKSEIVIFKTADEKISVDVRFEGETVWLTQAQLVDLYGSSKANVSEHIKHVSEEEELKEDSVVRNLSLKQFSYHSITNQVCKNGIFLVFKAKTACWYCGADMLFFCKIPYCNWSGRNCQARSFPDIHRY